MTVASGLADVVGWPVMSVGVVCVCECVLV